MNELNKSQAAKILSVYGVTPGDIIEKGKKAAIGETRNYSGYEYVKTAEGWKPLKTHGHVIGAIEEKQIVEPISVPVVESTIPTKSLIEIRNEKNKKLSLIEEKIDDHYRGISPLEMDELSKLRQDKIILSATIDKIDQKIKNTPAEINDEDEDEVSEETPELKITEDPDAEPSVIAA